MKSHESVRSWDLSRSKSTRNKQDKSINIDASPRSSTFSTWLQRVRLEQELSVEEVATKSGISLATIYNIESGRNQHPRRATIRLLQKTLKQEFSGVLKKTLGKRADYSEPDDDNIVAPLQEKEWSLQGSPEHRKVQLLLCRVGHLQGKVVKTNKDIGARVRPDVMWYKIDPEPDPSVSASHVFEIERGGSQPITKSLASLKQYYNSKTLQAWPDST